MFHDFIIQVTSALLYKVYKLYLNKILLKNRDTFIVKSK